MIFRAITLAAVFALFVGLAGPQTAVGQINPFGKIGGKLTAKDWELLNGSLQRLLEQEVVGNVAAWRNAKSGNSETLRLNRVFSQKGKPCRTVAHRFKLRREADIRQYIITYCKVGGSWKIAP